MPCKFSKWLAAPLRTAASSTALTALSVLTLLNTAACTTPSPPAAQAQSADLQTPAAPTPTVTPNTPVLSAATVATAPAAADSPPGTPAAAVVVRMLAYADRVRNLPPPELAAEITRLAEARSPAEQMQQALALAQLRQTPELIRAQDLLTRLLANASPESQALHPLARLLAQRFGEQRRFEDLLDKQSQQTRDTQRRLDQTTERLEALKAIERSLGGRAPAANAAPVTSGNGAPNATVRPRGAP